jgi:hypothetical protein
VLRPPAAAPANRTDGRGQASQASAAATFVESYPQPFVQFERLYEWKRNLFMILHACYYSSFVLLRDSTKPLRCLVIYM